MTNKATPSKNMGKHYKEPLRIKLIAFFRRNRSVIIFCTYAVMLGVMAAVIIEPNLIFAVLGQPSSNTVEDNIDVDEDETLLMFFNPRPTKETLQKHIDLPFVPKDFICENMFERANIEFKFPETYWDHSDAYKSALSLHELTQQASASEHSWILIELGRLPFVRTVCETGFNAGHNSFHWLTAQEDLIVHSFDYGKDNYTEELADFMAIEFPDRFFLYPGDPKVTVPKFVESKGNKTKCDIMYISSTLDDSTIETLLAEFGKMAHPLENLIVIDTHPKTANSSVFEDWDKEVKAKRISEIFRCYFNAIDELNYHNNNQRGFLVGSFVAR